MKAIIRNYVYWLIMDWDIEDRVKSCQNCTLASKSPVIKIQPGPKVSKPWSRLHVNYAGPEKGFYYLEIVDGFTKWSEVVKRRKATSLGTITILRELFSRSRIPDTVVTDNGTQFTAADFKELYKSQSIEHVTTPPYHPRSNGQAEMFVDTFNRAVKKSGGGD